MGSEFREKEAPPYLEKISAHATDKAAIYRATASTTNIERG